MKASREHVADFLAFLNRSVSPFHAVEQAKARLGGKGFQELKETDHWSVKPGGKYFFTRNASTLVAFAVGGKYKPGNGFSIIGAHTDSPCLRVKPKSKIESAGFLQVAVETYGGGLWYTWFDRDLTLGGKVIVQEGAAFNQKLVHFDNPILRIPTLAIHLDRTVNETGFNPNKENHLVPVLASAVKGKLENQPSDTKHHPLLLSMLAKKIGCDLSQIRDFELCVADTQPAVLGGALEEFVFSPRLDNLQSTYCAVKALIESCEGDSLQSDTNIRLVALFDHEEVGSESSHGAGSLMLESTLRRLSASSENQTAFEEAVVKSFVVSADQAHGTHPNYADKHEGRHRPELNQGIVIKYNSNQRYATNSSTAFVIKEIARRRNIPIQEVMVRNDSACGSTIGPILSSGLGIRTVDLGAAQLSMHSIREMSGADDVDSAISLFQGFFHDYPELFKSVQFD